MAEGMRVQFRFLVVWVIGISVVLFVLIRMPVQALCYAAGTNPSDPTIARSALGPVLLWCCCWPLAFTRSAAARPSGWILPLMWLFGGVLLCLHVAVAFHLGHQWSHQAAWQYTQQAGGFGNGIYLNYAVMVVWLVDAVWLCVARESYFTRPWWVHGSIHGFIAFIVVNAAAVFGSTQSRVLFAAGFLVPAFVALALWLRSRGRLE